MTQAVRNGWRNRSGARRGRGFWICGAVAGLLAGAAFAADPVVPSDRLLLADGLFRRGMFDLAVREYVVVAADTNAPPADPAGVLFRIGECHRRLKQPDEADAAYRRLIDAYPQSPERFRAPIQRAVLALEAGSLDAARAGFDALTAESFPSDIRQAALYHLGECLEKQEKPDEAIGVYTRLQTATDPTDYVIFGRLRLAWLLARGGDAEKRRRAMGLYLDLGSLADKPAFAADGLANAARLAAEDARHDESATLYLSLRRKYPDQPRTREVAEAAAQACLSAGRFVEALEIADNVLPVAAGEEREALLLQRGAALRQLGRGREAVAAYDLFLQQFAASSRVPQARYGRILALYREGDFAGVLAGSEGFLEPPAEVADDLLWMQAEAAEATGADDRAVQSCRMLADRFPRSPFAGDALYRIGWLSQKRQNWREASQAYLALVAVLPTHPRAPQALYASGICLERAGDAAGAVRDWTALLARHPEDPLVPETLYQKAMHELRVRDNALAAVTLDELLARFPQSPRTGEAAFWRGSLLRQADKPAEAEKLLRLALERKPPQAIDREARLQLGLVLQKLGRDEEAAACFQPLLTADTQQQLDPERLVWLAEFQLARKDYEASATALAVLLEKTADLVWQQTGLALQGRVNQAQGRRDAAVDAYARAVKLAPRTRYAAEAALALGTLQFEAGQAAAAEVSFRDAADRAPATDQSGLRARAYLGLVRTAQAQGKPEEAIRCAMSVAILFDDAELVPEALDVAAALLEQTGRGQESAAVVAELVQRYPTSAQARKRRPQ